MKILAFSDVHLARNRMLQIVDAASDADLVIGAGDFCNARVGIEAAMELLEPMSCKAVYVPGNAESIDELRDATEATVLHGDCTEVDGVRIYGIGYAVPVTPFGAWSCDLTEEQAEAMLAACEAPCDILISHSPPKGLVDVNASGLSLGSTSVRSAIERVQPKYCFCGHIHDSWRKHGMIGETRVHNLGPTVNWFEI